MTHYELLVLTPGSLQDADVEKVKDEVVSLIKNNEGTVTRAELWGRKRLAYPINDERHGVYALFEFDGGSDKLMEITRKLRLHAQILRHLLLIKKPMSARELERQEAAAKRAHARAARDTSTTTREHAGKTASATAPATAGATPTGPKISLEELDKKLDEILDKDILK